MANGERKKAAAWGFTILNKNVNVPKQDEYINVLLERLGMSNEQLYKRFKSENLKTSDKEIIEAAKISGKESGRMAARLQYLKYIGAINWDKPV